MKVISFVIELLAILGFNTAQTSGLGRPPLQSRQQACNGNAAFCDRPYSNVSLIGTHDSAFVGSIVDPRVNQEKSVPTQLDAGIRFLQSQTHTINNGAQLEMCHTTCTELDAGSFQNYSSTIKTWLDDSPDDVITLLIVNGDNVDVSMFDAVFSSTGLKQYAFVPSTSPNQLAINDWPTYAQMITANTRLVVFIDSKANQNIVPYILDEFTYFFETPYDTTDPNFAECTLDRPAGGSAAGRMYIVNHFLDASLFGILFPNDAADYTTNAATGSGSIGAQAQLCESDYQRPPNVVLVDMFDRGDVFAAQDALNGV
ncbi:hypothetical protein LTR78_007489 [Recurvomyces mirabilis]|uniref:PLC-like phosphodiesterase n=1 Tax=Recurvomyces mirabilis TaxID=574656 RepID=A0AAE0TSP5_9PEZI|nr:hypothetical protein LTR78_007489 [Recurvomyces mirabilis]KAK5160001.1 hypothetical protein LTS14_002107 [Recurvomyces mirabilis]